MLLLEPLSIGALELKNRIIMPAMTTRLASLIGEVTEELIDYYEARARGGVGLVILELSSPHPSGTHRRGELGIHADKFSDGLGKLIARLHKSGAKVGLQIGHAGSHARPDVTGYPAKAPSDVPHLVHEGDKRTVIPEPLTIDEIETCIGWYAAAAARLVNLGIDLIELQGAHDYLIAQFLSPIDNRRTDRYGGDIQGRARFAIETVAACKKAMGPTPLSCRINCSEFSDGGFSEGDAVQVSQLLVQAGVDMLSVSGGCARSNPRMITTAPMNLPPGLFVPFAGAVRRSVPVPVAVSNRVHDPLYAESVLANGNADLIALGRALIADPNWVKNLREATAPHIRPCIACNTCFDTLRNGGSMRCLVNPEAGRESFFRPGRAKGTNRYVIVGGGVAGMTAAVRLAEQGHRVTLFEGGDRLGGRLRHAHKAPFFQNVESSEGSIRKIIDHLILMQSARGVDVRLNSIPTVVEISAALPTAVFLATGAPYPPGLFWMLGNPVFRKIARHPSLRKLFLRIKIPARRSFERSLRDAGLKVFRIGDYAGTRGSQQAISGAALAVYLLTRDSKEEVAEGEGFEPSIGL